VSRIDVDAVVIRSSGKDLANYRLALDRNILSSVSEAEKSEDYATSIVLYKEVGWFCAVK
jgi:hypothetical protein